MSELSRDAARARHERLTVLFGQVRRLDQDGRRDLLERECESDPSLGVELRAMLQDLEAPGHPLHTTAPHRDLGPIAARILGDPSGAPTVDEGLQAAPIPSIPGYRIDRELGRGGMGVVYLAFDQRLGRRVAIKSLPDLVAAHCEAGVRLDREARLLALMSHPSIATLYGIEEHDGRLYLVLEFLDGETLAARLRRGPLDITAALTTCLRIAEGVHSAHRRGIIHRDLKPANVMLTSEGLVKVLDFGLARAVTPVADETTVGSRYLGIEGTPGYMSPEQAAGAEVGPASDLWSWACVLCECLTARMLWPGSSVSDRLRAVLWDPVDLGHLPATLPSAIVEILGRCLEKDPARRPTGMGEVVEVLGEALHPASASTGARRQARRRRGNLLAEQDAFVGRQRELGEISGLLEHRTRRLLTLLGPGGTGKTRLVQRYGLTRAECWPGGVWFCDLAEARTFAGILSAVAVALDVPLGNDPVTQLGDAIAARGRCLVILDNFEQIAEHATALLGRWLGRGGEAVFAVTSRIRLDLPGEEAYPVEPLDVESEGVELFAVRARLQRPSFTLSDANREAVIAIVRLVDSLPLAIELAAARIRVMTVEQIRDRLGDRFRLLTGRKGPARQASLTATLAWSWDLLGGWEQAALAQMSVFEGGFTLEAAEDVVDLSAWPEAPPVLDVLQALVDRSLVRSSLPEGADGLRFGMLVSVQAYAAGKLAGEQAIARGGSGPHAVAAAEARHGARFARLGDDAAADALGRQGGVARLHALALELDNLVAACRRAAARRDDEVAVRSLVAAWAVLRHRGPVAAGIDLARALAGWEDVERGLRARALFVHGEASWRAGQHEVARQSLEACRDLACAAGDGRCEGMALARLVPVYLQLGSLEMATESCDCALAIARKIGDRGLEGNLLNAQSALLQREARWEDSRQRLVAARAIADELGDRALLGGVLGNLGAAEMSRGRSGEARQLYEEALVIDREVGHRNFESVVLHNLGWLDFEDGRTEEARQHVQEAYEIARLIGDLPWASEVLTTLAQVLIEQGRLEEAGRHLLEALEGARRCGVRRLEVRALLDLGTLCLRQGSLREARERLEGAMAVAGDDRQALEAELLLHLGDLAARESRFDEARAMLAQGDAHARASEEPALIVSLLCQRGECERLAGDLAAARDALAEAEAVARKMGAVPGSQHDKRIQALRRALAETPAMPRIDA